MILCMATLFMRIGHIYIYKIYIYIYMGRWVGGGNVDDSGGGWVGGGNVNDSGGGWVVVMWMVVG